MTGAFQLKLFVYLYLLKKTRKLIKQYLTRLKRKNTNMPSDDSVEDEIYISRLT